MTNPNPTANSRQMLAKANVRIDLAIPTTADFTLVSFNDPLGCPTAPSAANLRMYRRPLPTANTHFLSTVMWDGRENTHAPNNTVALIEANLTGRTCHDTPNIGKTKGPNLRALAARAPYFHNGSANDLNAVLNFYEARFQIGFTTQEKSDLIAFLQAL